jgi:class 3 adenylate cyclase
VPTGFIGSTIARTFLGVTPSKMDPHLCKICERAANKYRGGTEIELSVLFVDVLGLTGLDERMSPAEFSQLIDRFYQETTRVLFNKNAFVEKLIGDAVNGFFVPGFAGKEIPHYRFRRYGERSGAPRCAGSLRRNIDQQGRQTSSWYQS